MEQKRERVAVKSSDRAMTVTQASDLLNQRVHYCVTVLQKKRKGTKKKKERKEQRAQAGRNEERDEAGV